MIYIHYTTILNKYEQKTLLWRGPYNIETNPLICRANLWTCFYLIGTCVIKEWNTSEKSDRVLPILGIMSPYLHGYVNHLDEKKNSEFKIRLREQWRLTNSCTAHAWDDIPWNLNVFKLSTERKNILFHVLSKPEQKAQGWRKHLVQNSF